MIEPGWIVAIVFMVILSVIDIKSFHLKKGFIPAVATTGFLIFAFIYGVPFAIFSGVLSFLIGMFLVDFDIFHGVADWKVFVACGFVLPSLNAVLVFGLFTTIVAVGYKTLSRKVGFKEIPFIPAILIAFLGTIGVILL